MKTMRLNNGGVVKLDLSKLTAIQEILKSKFTTQVGVLGSKAAGRKDVVEANSGAHKAGRKASDMSNADLGLVHEKGSLTRGIPRRSFLLMPLQQKAEMLVSSKSVIWNKFLAGDQSLASLRAAYRDMGIFAENIIHAAFNTGGFGKWPKLTQQTIARKKSSAILIDSRQLERSIDSRVVAK
jgi:hypothetical protein